MMKSYTVSALFMLLLAPFSANGFFTTARSSSNRVPFVSTTTRISSSSDAAETPITLPDFNNAEDYVKYLDSGRSKLPKGFATGTAQGTFISAEAPAMGDLPIKGTVIYLPDGPTNNWAAVFTQNKCPGAPVIVGRKRLASGKPLQALVINNKVSNVCSGGDGVGNAELVCEAVAKELDLSGGSDSVLPSSTGVIGWRLPAKELAEQIVPKAIEALQSETALPAAQSIMTTDRFPKVRSKVIGTNGARIVGIAKGAGMIEPNMATMLSYIMTDATVPKDKLQQMLSKVVDQSFNSMSVDGDESTSDTVVLIASNQVESSTSDDDEEEAFYAEFESALSEICTGLAADIVRNGEGTGHVMRVQITNFPGPALQARRLGRHIVNSPLFKCAVSGNDPNTGRLAGAIGSYMGKYVPEWTTMSDMTLTLGGRSIMANGKFILEGDAVEKELSDHMQDAQYDEHSDYPPHQKFVEIGVDFGANTKDGSTATILGSDLTGEYVVINADYRS